mgnify:FL=1
MFDITWLILAYKRVSASPSLLKEIYDNRKFIIACGLLFSVFLSLRLDIWDILFMLVSVWIIGAFLKGFLNTNKVLEEYKVLRANFEGALFVCFGMFCGSALLLVLNGVWVWARWYFGLQAS